MTDVVAPLTIDEHTVLELASQGQAMLAIGRWKDATEALYARGLLNQQTAPGGGPEYFITHYGKQALKKFEGAETAESGRIAGQIVEIQTDIQSGITRAAEFFVQAARQSSMVTGDSMETSLRKWIFVCQDEALKQLRS